MKTSFFNFVSPLGRHNPRSLGADIGLNEFMKKAKYASKPEDMVTAFANANNVYANVERILRIATALGKLTTVGTHNGHNSILNNEKSLIPLLTNNCCSHLGGRRSDAFYYKTITHIGKPTGSRIKKIQSGPYVQTLTKSTSNSYDDYRSHEKRNQLHLSCGFNEKGFTFLTEDTYFSVKDYYALFKVGKRFKKELEQSTDGIKEIYGCVLKTHNQLKIKNTLDFYSVHLRIHLIQIMDTETDVRSLIEEITHNPFSKTFINAGKIPKDFQYQDPIITDTENKFSISFITNLTCSLGLSTRFRQRAQVVKSWSHTLTPGSTWEFNLNTHMGRGIHINTIYDIYSNSTNYSSKIKSTSDYIIKEYTKIAEQEKLKKKKSKEESEASLNEALKEGVKDILKNAMAREFMHSSEHPVNYVFCLEYVGDRRASLMRNADKDIFSGYSPCNLNLEFDTRITYLTNEGDDDELLVYKRPRQQRNFDDESDFKDVFCPNRDEKFHVPLTEINLANQNEKVAYTLVYDQNLGMGGDQPNFMSTLQQVFEDFGWDPKNATQDDQNLNFKNPPSPDTESDSE